MRYALVMCMWLCAFAASPPALGEPLSPGDFAARIVKALSTSIPEATVTVRGDYALSLRQPDGRSANFNLANIYNAYRQEPAQLDQLLARLVAAATEPCKANCGSAAIDRSRVVPVIKDRAWLDELRAMFRMQSGGEAIEPLYEDFAGELVIVYAEDTANRTRYLSAAEDTGIPRAELRAQAVDNLRRLLSKIELRQHDDFARISAGGDYDASLLLFDDLWSGAKVKVDGDIVVAVPAKDILLVTGSQNRKGLKVVRQLAANIVQKESYRLVDTLFVYRNGRFAKFGRGAAPKN